MNINIDANLLDGIEMGFAFGALAGGLFTMAMGKLLTLANVVKETP